MKPSLNKIRDYIEPALTYQLTDYRADQSRVLSNYRFTEVTSDLLGRWLDNITSLAPGQGLSHVLAGPRGAGKSHTAAVFGAILSSLDLRSNLPDAHVASRARLLKDLEYRVARIERGSCPALGQEIKRGLSSITNDAVSPPGEDIVSLVAGAASAARDSRLAILIDSHSGGAQPQRPGEVEGLHSLLSAAEQVNALVVLVLDDDLAATPGINALLARNFRIDYLDPEHLFRVLDSVMLRKHSRGRAGLSEIYNGLRASVPAFNWSEARFSSLYPIHPIIADVGAEVRRHAPSFALLPFAAASVARAANRSALSLVLLDEVFDCAEPELRKASGLHCLFAAYDEIVTTSVPQLPALQRLHARILLKSLFILSLRERGVTANELRAALLVSGKPEPGRPFIQLEQTLAHFQETHRAIEVSKEGDEAAYRLYQASGASEEEVPEESAATPIKPEDTLDRATLLEWAQLLSGASSLNSIDDPQSRELVTRELATRMSSIEKTINNPLLNVANVFSLPLSFMRAIRVFNVAIAGLRSVLDNAISLEEGLGQVVNAFSGSTERFKEYAGTLKELDGLTEAAREFERIRVFISNVESTGIPEIEAARTEVAEMVQRITNPFEEEARARLARAWGEFQTRYRTHYTDEHERFVGGARDWRSLDQLLRSDTWREFEMLSELPGIDRRFWRRAQSVLDNLRRRRCDLRVSEQLVLHPFCACGFRPRDTETISGATRFLEEIARSGRLHYFRFFSHMTEEIAREFERSMEPISALSTSAMFAEPDGTRLLSRSEISLIGQALRSIDFHQLEPELALV